MSVMTLRRSIIVTTDFSVTATNAVTYAAGFAKATGLKLTIFNPFSLPIDNANSNVLNEDVQKEFYRISVKLKTYCNEISKLFNIEVDYFCSCSSFEDEVISMVKNTNAEIVVIGITDRSFEEDLMNNTVKSIIKNIDIAVLAVPENARFINLNRILFALDNESLSCIEKSSWFMAKAELLHAEIDFLSVNEKIEKLVHKQEKVNMKATGSHIGVGFAYKNRSSNAIIYEIKEEIVSYNANILVMVQQKGGFWNSSLNLSKTLIMVSKLDIPLLSLGNF